MNVQEVRLVVQGMQAGQAVSGPWEGGLSAGGALLAGSCWLARERKDFGVQPYSSLNNLLK